MTSPISHPRVFDTPDLAGRVPVYVVWELTLACNLSCSHCGSRAGSSRAQELSTDECFRLIDHLAELGTREITIIGGEAFLRRDWLLIIKRIADKGIFCTMQTGGLSLSLERLRGAAEAGLKGVGISIDGLEATHDGLRRRKGSFKAALAAAAHANACGLEVSANTQINAQSAHELNDIYGVVREAAIRAWQLQLTVAMGNAADNDHILLQPFQLIDVMPTIATLVDRAQADGIRIVPGNNIGYFGPYEHLLRGPNYSSGAYSGCLAGVDGMGIEADGTVKGCPSLATARYSEGNVREKAIKEIWLDDTKFNLNRGDRRYAGYCARCYYREHCRSGCVWTSDALFGEPGNNPYCYHRVLELKKENIKERVAKRREASGDSFGTGLLAILEEAWDG